MILLAVATERSFVRLAGQHVDAVSGGAALPATFLGADFLAERDVKRPANLVGREEPQPRAPTCAERPLALLDVRRRFDSLSVEVVEHESRLRHARYSIALFLPAFDAAAIVQARPEVLAGEVVQTEPDEAPLRPRQETTPLTVRLAVVGLPPVADAQVPIHQRHSEFPAVGVPVPVAA